MAQVSTAMVRDARGASSKAYKKLDKPGSAPRGTLCLHIAFQANYATVSPNRMEKLDSRENAETLEFAKVSIQHNRRYLWQTVPLTQAS